MTRPAESRRRKRQTVLTPIARLQRASVDAMNELGLAPGSSWDHTNLTPAQLKQKLATEAPPLSQGTVPRRVPLPGRLVAMFSNGPSLSASCLASAAVVGFSGRLVKLDSYSPIAWWSGLGFISVIVLLLVVHGVLRGRKALELVIWGRLAWAIIIANEEVIRPGPRSGGERNHMTRVRFAYNAGGDTIRTATIDLDAAWDLQDEEFELLVYNPQDPSQFQFADLLTGWLRIGTDATPEVWKPGYAVLAAAVLTPIILGVILYLL
jgi:hypothetical protein